MNLKPHKKMEIEDAKIVEETKVVDEPQKMASDLQARLQQITPKKEPGQTQVKNPEVKKSFWEQSESDFDIVEPRKEEKPASEEKTASQEQIQDENKPKGKLTEKLKLGSAKTAVGMFEFTSKLLFTPILNIKLKKKCEKSFTAKQLEALDDKIIEAEENELDATELKIKNRFDSIIKKHEKKINAIPFSETEKTDLQDAFYNYFDVTETEISPGWYMAMAITNTMGSRAIDAFTD